MPRLSKRLTSKTAAAAGDFPPTTDMFGEAPKKNSAPSPFYKVTPQKTTTGSAFPVLSMRQGFDRAAAKNDALLTLRLTANQNAKALPATKKLFLTALNRELALKQGRFEAEIMMRDALMERFLKNK